MNELTIQELKIHVERIVQPVSATQGRKLRMREELLAHLQAIWEEECGRFPGDERATTEHTKLRLGESTQLSRELQHTVPLVERMLLRRFPLSHGLETLERRMACVPGQHGPMTMGHKIILSGIATLAFVPLYMSLHSALTTSGMETAHLAMSIIGTPLGWYALLFASYRFVFEAANGNLRLDWSGTLKRGVTILTLQLGLAVFLALAVANRAATPSEIIACAASTVTLLAASLLIARRIGMLRRPYDEWLTLDIVE